MHELPLVFFTVLTCAAVGFVCYLGTASRQSEMTMTGIKTSISVAFLLAAVGTLASLTHLGMPFRAINSLFRLGASPMSNEIASVGVFNGALFVTVVLAWLKEPKPALIRTCVIISAIIGIFAVQMIANVYSIDTVPAWDNVSSSFSVFGMMLTLGAGLHLVFGKPHIFTKAFFTLGAILSLLFMIRVVQITTGIYQIPAGVFSEWIIEVILLMAAMFILFSETCSRSKGLQVLAILMLFIAMLVGRIAFYDLWSVAL